MENKLLNIIQDWVNVNKKVFWKYEVSSYYETYKISITNLPKPTNEDIKLQSYNLLLNNNQKTQLCNTIKKVYSKTEKLTDSSIKVKVDYVNGVVTAAVI
jgi:hypothetical protein